MSHLYYWGLAAFIAVLIGFYGCYRHSGKPPSTIVRKIQQVFGVSACCYAPARPAPPAFTCPVCGKTTRHGYSPDTEALTASFRLESLFEDLKARGNAPDWTMEFDKTQFCQNCTSGGTGPPRLVLIVTHSDEEEPHRFEGVSLNDLVLIHDYLSQKGQRFDSAAGAMQPMEHFHERLNKLLGLSLREEEAGTGTDE